MAGRFIGVLKENKEYVRTAAGMAWPSVLESFFVALAGMVDSLMVSAMGPAAVAAVGLTTQPKFIGLSMFIAMNVSVSALVARRKGQKDRRGDVYKRQDMRRINWASAIYMEKAPGRM